MSYSKWIGAGLGWMVGGPIGGLLGFAAGGILNSTPEAEAATESIHVSELEACLLVIASHVIKTDGRATLQEIEFVRQQLIATNGEYHIDEKMQVFHHCLAHEYELEKSCGYIRIYQSKAAAIQSLRWAFAIAICDKELSEKERKLLFYIAASLDISKALFLELLTEWQPKTQSLFDLFELKETATKTELVATYRKLVLKFHPDRNPNYNETQRKQAELKLQQLREAYEKLLKEKYSV